ncbi:MAG: hypothetical protein J6K33_01750 [Alistipes sp.]|nr:hypothetical protein [Alistipes sp.]MBQ8854298.1 hypothetical protein [Alistipes sp.]
MKRITLLICALFVTSVISAQSRTVEYDGQQNTVTVTRVKPKRVDQHDLRIGIGSPSLGLGLFVTTYADDYYYKNFREEILDAKTYDAGTYFTGIYSLSYAYHSRRWLQCGATVNFALLTNPTRYVEDNTLKSRETGFMVSVMPTFRFVYLYREKVQLYSTVSVGLAGGSSGMMLPWADFTLIGCTFGRKLFGFVELGSLTGTGGCGRVGIGYRFDSKKRR